MGLFGIVGRILFIGGFVKCGPLNVRRRRLMIFGLLFKNWQMNKVLLTVH